MDGNVNVEIPKSQSDVKTLEVSKSKEDVGPKIKYEFFFSPHYSPTDMKKLEDRFQKADIYIPEAHGWTQEQLDILRDVASGKIDVSQKFPGEDDGPPSHRLAIKSLRMIYNSHKPITLVDVPRAQSKERVILDLDWDGDFRNALTNMRKIATQSLKETREREKYILENIEPKVKDLIDENPSLEEKKEISVLISLGLAHEPIYIDLKKGRGEVISFLGQPLIVYSYMEEGSRRLRFNKAIDDDLASKMYLEMNFNGAFGQDIDNLTEDYVKQLRLKRKIVSQFSIEDIEQMFELFRRGEDIRRVITDKFREKNIIFPKSEQELDDFLARPLPHPPNPSR